MPGPAAVALVLSDRQRQLLEQLPRRQTAAVRPAPPVEVVLALADDPASRPPPAPSALPA